MAVALLNSALTERRYSKLTHHLLILSAESLKAKNKGGHKC